MVREPFAFTAAFLVLLTTSGCAREGGFEVPTSRFESAQYGFTVEHPDTMDVREYIPERVSIGFSAGDGFDPRVEVELASDSSMTFEELLEHAARNSCFADGHGVSVHCTEIDRRGTIRAASGERGEVLYLTIEIVEPPSGRVIESMRRGPYVAFDGSDLAGGLTTVLFVRAPITRQLHETDVDLVLNVARSLRIEER